MDSNFNSSCTYCFHKLLLLNVKSTKRQSTRRKEVKSVHTCFKSACILSERKTNVLSANSFLRDVSTANAPLFLSGKLSSATSGRNSRGSWHRWPLASQRSIVLKNSGVTIGLQAASASITCRWDIKWKETLRKSWEERGRLGATNYSLTLRPGHERYIPLWHIAHYHKLLRKRYYNYNMGVKSFVKVMPTQHNNHTLASMPEVLSGRHYKTAFLYARDDAIRSGTVSCMTVSYTEKWLRATRKSNLSRENRDHDHVTVKPIMTRTHTRTHTRTQAKLVCQSSTKYHVMSLLNSPIERS